MYILLNDFKTVKLNLIFISLKFYVVKCFIATNTSKFKTNCVYFNCLWFKFNSIIKFNILDNTFLLDKINFPWLIVL